MPALLYGNVVEPLIRSRIDDNLDKYMPMKAFSALTPLPNREMLEQATGIGNEILGFELALAIGFAYAVLFCVLGYLVLKTRDL